MGKALFVLLIIAGAFFICMGEAYGQARRVTTGEIPLYSYDYRPNVVERLGDSLFIVAGDDNFIGCFTGPGQRDGWPIRLFGNCCLAELLLSPLRDVFIYDRTNHVLVYGNGTDTTQIACPGRPILDAGGNIHMIWRLGSGSTYCYGYSTDTLASFGVLDTLTSFPDFIFLVSSPDDSLVAAIFYNYSADSVYKYMSQAGHPLNFQSPSTVTSCEYYPNSAFDITLDYDGNLFALIYGDNNYYNWCPNWAFRCHFVWTEQYGYRFLERTIDDVTDGTTVQFLFSGPDTVLLLESKGLPWCEGMSFFMSPDRGQTWYKSLYDLLRYTGCDGSAPRFFGDNLDLFYFTQSQPHAVYYLPIPRDSIFSQLVSIDGGETPVPYDISLFNYPNPFNAQTTISFSLAGSGQVSLVIYDITGRLVETLIDGELGAGPHLIIWNAADIRLSSGVYFARLKTDNKAYNRRLVLLK